DTSTTQVTGSPGDSLLASWVPAADLPDGEYSLRLVVTDDLERDYESRIEIDLDQFDPPEMSGWPQLPERGRSQLIPMMPTVADLDSDGDLEILLGPYAWQHDGTPIVNHAFGFFVDYPFALSFFVGFHGPPAVGDIDGDGDVEIVLIESDALAGVGAIRAFEHDGQSKPGWPRPISYPAAIGRTATPVLADIDGDSVLDVIVLDSDPLTVDDCRLDVFRGDGSLILSRSLAGECLTIPTIADLDGDGRPEIIVLGGDGRIFAVDHNGHPAPIWPQNFRVDDQFDYTAPSIGDLDGDGGLDIVVSSFNGQVYAFASNGLALEGWPAQVAGGDPSIPALADLDRDGRLEIVIGDRDGAIHVFDHRGATLEGWPKKLDGPANTTPAIADIDGDGQLDIVAVTGDRKVHAWDLRGREIIEQGWPIATGEYAADSPFPDQLGLAAAPLVADLDADGDREVVAYSRNLHVWDLPEAAYAISGEWPQYRANERSSGNVDEALVVRPPTVPRIFASTEFNDVADIEAFPISFDSSSPGAEIADASWRLIDADDPERVEIVGWLDGIEVNLAASHSLPEEPGLYLRIVRIPDVGRYHVRASIQAEPHPHTGAVERHVFTSNPIDVAEIAPANPRAEMIPGPSVLARTTAAARVEIDLVPGLRRFDFRVVRLADPGEPVLGTLDIEDLGEVNELGDSDLTEPGFIGLTIDPESPIDAAFSVNEVGEYEIQISILAY
ncbi:MAG: VCBS repeat-containing protein, partial [Myxococcota bacterium]